MNKNLNHEEMVSKSKTLRSLPRTLFVELTRSCNMYCTCCRPEIYMDKSMNMSDEILSLVENELFPTAEVIDFRGWGESTLDDRLLKLVQKWQDKGKELFIYTNCQARTPQYWSELFSLNLNVAISIRAAQKNVYEQFMRGAKYERLLSHLIQIPVQNKVIFTVVVDDENIDELEGIVRLAAKYNIHTVHLNPLVQRKKSSDYPSFGVEKKNKKYLIKKLAQLSSLAKSMGISVLVCSDLLDEGNFDLKQCIHPWSYVYIAYNGDIGFCDHLMCVDDAMMGNITDGFLNVWNSVKYQDLRRIHSERVTGEVFGERIECKWCYKNRYANWEQLLEKDKHAFNLDEYIEMKLNGENR